MRTSLLILLSLALGLLGFIVFFERGSLSTTERQGRKGRVLDSFVRERVSRIEIQRKGVTTVLVRDETHADDPLAPSGWRVEKPYAAQADQTVVDALIGALEWIEPRRSLGEVSAKELVEFGLDKPRYRVRFRAGRDDAGFSLGAPAADGGGAYLRPLGRSVVYVVGKDVVEALDHESADYHDKTLQRGVSMLTFESLELSDASGLRKLVRRDGFDWLSAPYQSLASTPSLTGVVDAFDALRATRYIDSSDRPELASGLDAPSFSASLTSTVLDKTAQTQPGTPAKSQRKSERLELRVGRECAGHSGEHYLRVGTGALFCAADSELAKLHKSADELRETRLLPLDDSEIRSVRLRDGGRELVLTTKEQATTCTLTQPGHDKLSGTADPAALTAWYAALRGATIQHFDVLPPSTKAGLDAHALQASFERGAGLKPYLLQVGQGPLAGVATRLDDPAQLRTPSGANELFSISAARFRKPHLLDEDETHFQKLVIAGPVGVSQVVTKVDAGYELDGPVPGIAQRARVDEILRLVSKLDAVRFVADAAQPEHGLSEPARSLRIEYTASPNPHVHTLQLGAASADGGRYARLDLDPAVFVISAALAQLIEEPLVSSDRFGVAIDRVASFAISVSGKRIELTHDADGFKLRGAESDAARSQALVAALQELSRAHALDYGTPPVGSGLDRSELQVIAKTRDGHELSWAFGAAIPGASPSAVFARRTDVAATWSVPRDVVDRLREAKPLPAK
jgi:hypothetical protein